MRQKGKPGRGLSSGKVLQEFMATGHNFQLKPIKKCFLEKVVLEMSSKFGQNVVTQKLISGWGKTTIDCIFFYNSE